MMTRARSLAGLSWGALGATRSARFAYLVLVPLAAGVAVAVLPSVALKLAAVVGVGGLGIAMLLAWRGMVLDPAWVIVAQLYLLAPIGSLLIEAGVGFSIITALVLAFMPFVLATLLVRPASRSSLLLLAPIALLALFAGLSVAWSAAPDYGLEKMTVWLVSGVVPAATILVLYTAKGSISWRLILLASVVYAVALLVIGEPWSGGGSRLTLVDQNPIWAARAVLIGALVALLGPFPMWVKVVTVPVLVLAGLLTQSLGPLVGLAAGLMAGAVTALALVSRREGRPSSGWTALVLAMGFAVVILLSGVLDPLIGPLINDPNVTSRTGYIDASVRLFLGSPLYGIGIGGFQATGIDQYPHNFVLEVALELGLAGLVGLVAWTVLAIIGAVRSPLVMGLVVGTGAFTLFSGSIASQAEFWMFSAIGVALAPVVLGGRRDTEPASAPAESLPSLSQAAATTASRSG